MEVRKGYKHTDVGLIPNDWDVNRLKELTILLTNGFVGKAKTYYTESDDGVLYIQGFNVEENSFNMTGIKRVTNEFHKQHQKSNLREGDLLTIQTGEIGLTTIIPKKLEGSNCHALIISRFKDYYNPKYFSYYFNSFNGRKRFKDIETGTTMKHLNVGDMENWLVPYPTTKEEQTAIAQVLSDTDELISSLEKLIEKKKLIKQGTMQQLLTGKKRLPGFSGKWNVKPLNDFLEYEQPTNYIVKDTEYDEENGTPVLTAGKTFILGYTNEEFGIFNNLPVIIFDDFTTATKFVDFPFKVKSSAMKILKPRNDKVNLRFIYEMIQRIIYPMGIGDHKRHWIANYQFLEIVVPDPKEQEAISKILSDMDSEIVSLEEKLNKYKSIKQGMMQNLLTGKIRLV